MIIVADGWIRGRLSQILQAPFRKIVDCSFRVGSIVLWLSCGNAGPSLDSVVYVGHCVDVEPALRHRRDHCIA